MSLRIPCANGENRERAVSTALAAVRRGDLVLVPMESTYALMTDAFSSRGVSRLRDAKGYDSRMPVPVMIGSKSTVAGVATGLTDSARALMDAYWPGLLTVMVRPQSTLAWELPPDAPLSLRMPLHPLALALLAATGPLVATSANIPGLPAPSDADDAIEQIGKAVFITLDAGDLATADALPSTVVDVTGEIPVMVREGAISLAELRAVCEVGIPGQDQPDK